MSLSLFRLSTSYKRALISSQNSRAFYYTRAHPKSRPVVPIPDAVNFVLDDLVARTKKKQKKENYVKRVIEYKKQTPRPARNFPDETIELALNLNVDPRKPGQSLRGSLALPHGTGKKGQSVVVFSNDEEIVQKAKDAGALHVGSKELVDDVVAGKIPLDFQAALATPEMVQIMTKAGAARILGPKGLMPNKKVGTIVETVDTMLEQLETYQAAKQVTYRTEKEGIVHVPVGKASFGKDKLLDNIGEVMKAIFAVKPEAYGKGKKQKKNSKQQPLYLLRATVSATQGKGCRVDLRTMDPGSAFFLQDVNPLSVGKKEESVAEDKPLTVADNAPSEAVAEDVPQSTDNDSFSATLSEAKTE